MSYPILKPNSSWFTPTASTITRSTITSINIVDSYTPSTTPVDSWDASVVQDGSIMCYVEDTVLTIAGNGSGRIQANEDSSFMFSDIGLTDYFTALTTLNNLSTIDFSTATSFKAIFRNCLIVNLDVSGIDTSNVTTFHSAFRQCSKLVTLDLSSWDASKCEDLYAMFYKCSALTEVNVTGWNTPNLTTVDYLFDQCTELQRFDATAFNAAKLTTMYGMFQNCSPLTELDVSGWDTSNVINMSFAFWGCKGLTRLDVENWNVSNVENFDHLFAHCNNLVVDVTNWKTSSKCKYYTAMFHTNANEYLDVSGFDTSGAISMALMFEANTNLKKIKGLENFDTSNVASFQEMFFNCWNIEELDLSNFDTRKADTVTPVRSDGKYPSDCTYFMLNGCRSLKKITLGENFTFAGDGTATGDQIGTLPVQNDTYIDGADGNWYTLDGTAYAPADIPNLTAATYYASPIIVKEVIWERDSKKYMHLSAMKTYQNLQNIAIDSKMNELKKTFLAKNQGASNVGKILVVGTDGNLTPTDKGEITPEVSQIEAPKIVSSVDEMTDTAKHYVNKVTNTIWAYMMRKTVIPESNYNVFNYDTNNGSRINTRLSREGTESATNGAKGSFITNYIELTDWNNYSSYNMYINFQLQSITLSATTAVFYDADKNVVGNVVGYEGSNTDNIITTSTSSVFDLKRDANLTDGVVNIPNAKYVRVQLFKKESGTALTTADLEGVEIMLEANKTPSTTIQGYGWTDTGISYTPTFKTDLVGIIGEGNVIYLSSNLPSGIYTLKDADNDNAVIGTYTV